MNEQEEQRFESELRRLRPARPPQDFLARLAATDLHQPTPSLASPPNLAPAPNPNWLRRRFARFSNGRTGLNLRISGFGFRISGFAGAAAVLILAGFFWRAMLPTPAPTISRSPTTAATAPAPALKVDDVQIDHELVSTFDAVGTLPSGEPVRFRCREWMDDVVLRDRARQVSIERRTPRVEIVPVRFETY